MWKSKHGRKGETRAGWKAVLVCWVRLHRDYQLPWPAGTNSSAEEEEVIFSPCELGCSGNKSRWCELTERLRKMCVLGGHQQDQDPIPKVARESKRH